MTSFPLELSNFHSGSYGAIWYVWETSPWRFSIWIWASMMSTSGMPRPTSLLGPGWSSPGQVQAEYRWPGRYERVPPSWPVVSAASGPVPFGQVWFGSVPMSQVSYE